MGIFDAFTLNVTKVSSVALCDKNYLSANIVNNCYILDTSYHYRWKVQPHVSIKNTTLTWPVILEMDHCDTYCVQCIDNTIGSYTPMLWAKYGFAESMGVPTQSSDQYLPNYNPLIVRLVPCIKYGLSRRGFVFWSHCLFEVMKSELAIYSYVSNITYF